MTKNIFITGTTGFIGYHLSKKKVDVLLFEVLDFLLSYLTEAQGIGMRARKIVLKHYTGDKVAEKTIKIYEEALIEKSGN